MSTQEIPFGAWSHNLRIANDSVEILISLEVGPRVLSYRPLGGSNIFHNYSEHMGGSAETEWMNRGGHRLWIAPEDPVLSYALDNAPFPYEILGENSVRLTSLGDPARAIRKDLQVELAANGSAVKLTHTLTNETAETHHVAPWALTVMAPGGVSVLPQPPLGEHPRDLLPNRTVVLWPYSDTSDARFLLGKQFIALRQEKGRPPFKYGLTHQGKWAAYLLGDQLFVKTVSYLEGATYPDFGCNYESFTNNDMLEIETLGPLTPLTPGSSISHVENWSIYGDLRPPVFTDSAAFADWLQPYLPA